MYRDHLVQIDVKENPLNNCFDFLGRPLYLRDIKACIVSSLDYSACDISKMDIERWKKKSAF